jgi:hypothetical protein
MSSSTLIRARFNFGAGVLTGANSESKVGGLLLPLYALKTFDSELAPKLKYPLLIRST